MISFWNLMMAIQQTKNNQNHLIHYHDDNFVAAVVVYQTELIDFLYFHGLQGFAVVVVVATVVVQTFLLFYNEKKMIYFRKRKFLFNDLLLFEK